MLLIVTNKRDLATDYLILRLNELGIEFWRLNTEDYLQKFDIEISFKGTIPLAIITRDDGSKLVSSDIVAAYIRQPVVPVLRNYSDEGHTRFVQREAIEALRSLWRVIDEKAWLNNPKNLLIASNKIDQLRVAKQLGFRIPRTLISTNLDNVQQFIKQCDGATIAKAVKHGFYRHDGEVYLALTQKVDSEFLSNVDQYSSIPMIYQEEVEKIYDVRVTVVGTGVYATAIQSQEHEETKTDWRNWNVVSDVNLRHERMVLPVDIQNRCLELTRSFGLSYSAIDMICSTDGNFFFLEMNPNGQWAWIEGTVGYPIRDAIINTMGYEIESGF